MKRKKMEVFVNDWLKLVNLNIQLGGKLVLYTVLFGDISTSYKDIETVEKLNKFNISFKEFMKGSKQIKWRKRIK